jgi:hypothetical protein
MFSDNLLSFFIFLEISKNHRVQMIVFWCITGSVAGSEKANLGSSSNMWALIHIQVFVRWKIVWIILYTVDPLL